MKNVNILNALSRKSVGTNSSKKVRQANQIPAIIYGDGIKPEAISLTVPELRVEIQKSSFINKVYDIALEKNKVRVIVQEISQNPVTEKLEHIDFLRVNDKIGYYCETSFLGFSRFKRKFINKDILERFTLHQAYFKPR